MSTEQQFDLSLMREGRKTISREAMLVSATEFRTWVRDEDTGVTSAVQPAPGKEAYEVKLIIDGEEKRPVILKSAFKNGIVPSIGLNPIPCRIEAVKVKYFSKQQNKEVEGYNYVSVVYNDEDLSDKSLKVMIAKNQQSFQL